MLIWWTPLAAGCLVIEANSLRRTFQRRQNVPRVPPWSHPWTIAAAGVLALCLAGTPLGVEMMTGRRPRLAQSVSAQTPIAAVDWLRQHPPAGQVFNTFEWGDYLVWNGPPNIQVFVTSQAHLVPREVWGDYMAVIEVAPDWNAILNRSRVETVLLDKKERGALIAALMRERRWVRAFDDDVATIFTRHR